MKFEELSKEDQALVNTDFGEFDKIAQAELQEADELFAFGMEKAAAAADEQDEEDEEAKKKELSEEHKKEAAARGIIIAEGMIEKLASLGVERHGDELHYFYPAIEEKLAAANDPGKVRAFINMLKDKSAKGVAKAKEMAGKAKDKTIEYHQGANRGLKAGVIGVNEHGQKLDAKTRAKAFGIGAAKYAPHAAAAGGAGYGVHKLLSGKKKEE